MDTNRLNEMKLSQAKTIVTAAIQNTLNNKGAHYADHIVPYLEGGAGLGKTSIVFQIGAEMECDVRVMSLTQYDPGELAGWLIPNKDNTGMNRLRPDWMPDGARPTILFFDELAQAPVANQNVFAQISNERRCGVHELPSNVAIVAAGNRMQDRAGTQHMPTHVRDRLMFLRVEADTDETVNYFLSIGVDSRVSSYLRFRPSFLHKFDRDQQACPSPRSWERVSTILGWNLPPSERTSAIIGQVGASASADFAAFLAFYEEVPDLDKVIADPDKAPVPSKSGVLHALCGALADKSNDKNIKNIIRYIRRVPQAEFQAYMINDIRIAKPQLMRDPSIRDWTLKEGGMLFDDAN